MLSIAQEALFARRNSRASVLVPGDLRYYPLPPRHIHEPADTRRGRAQGVVIVLNRLEERTRDLAAYLLENRSTVRAAAGHFGVSKSTVHKDLTERLPRLDPALFAQVRELLDWNKAQRHIRGGLATRRKYKGGAPV